MTEAPRRFPLGIYIFVLVLIVILGCLPAIAFVIAAILQPIFGCTMGTVTLICDIGGRDLGVFIDMMGLSIWLFVFTAPIGLLLFGVWLAVFIVHLMNAAGRSRKTPAA